MATTIWNPDLPDAPDPSDPSVAPVLPDASVVPDAPEPRGIAVVPDAGAAPLSYADLMERRARGTATVRRFVRELAAGRDSRPASDLSDEDWERIWSAARGADSEELAIARVVLEAYRVRRAPIAPFGTVRGTPIEEVRDTCPDVARAGVPGAVRGTSHHIVRATVPADFASAVPATIPLDFASAPPSPLPVPRTKSKAPAWLWLEPLRDFDEEVRRWLVHRLPARRHAKPRVRTLTDERRNRWLSVASWVRNFGALLILFAAWQLWGTAITYHHSQAALKKEFAAKVNEAKPTATFALTPATAHLADPPEGTVMGLLQIPKIGADESVVSGTGTDDLNLGPGHYLYTAQPGQAGNVAIAGHRTTHGAPFNRLAELAPGDPIYLTTTSGQRLTYIVSAPPNPVSPTDVSVLNNFGDNRLTLTTCNPEFSARQRLIVVAAYQPPGAAHPEAIAKGGGRPYRLAAAVSSGWAMSLVPLVLIELALAVALGLANRRLSRTYGRMGRWLILIPVWAAVLLALFQTLTEFLPGSI